MIMKVEESSGEQTIKWGQLGRDVGCVPELPAAMTALVEALRGWRNRDPNNDCYRGGVDLGSHELVNACRDVVQHWSYHYRISASNAVLLYTLLTEVMDDEFFAGALDLLDGVRSNVTRSADFKPQASTAAAINIWTEAAKFGKNVWNDMANGLLREQRSDYTTEQEARDAGELVYRAPDGQLAWCLCRACTLRHARRKKRRTRHDRWAMNGEFDRIREDARKRGWT